MRPELEIIEKIEQYLRGELNAADKAAFEKQIAADPSLKEQVNLQQDIMRGIERTELKMKIVKAGKSFKFGKSFTQWGLGGLSLVVLVGAFLFYKSQAGKNEYGKNSLPELNEQGEKLWADADRNIQAQVFTIDAAKDTVIETKGGIVMAIPANDFLDENGNIVEGKVNFTVKEALDPATMINAGLSTRSGNELLESGGMFFTDARKDGKILKINSIKGIYTEIPANEIKPGMQLFSGKRMADGTIDWIDPKPLEHDLVAVDIKTLNFYPPNYLDSLAHWGHDIKNKTFTDSLYYSFASRFAQPATTDSTKEMAVIYENELVSADLTDRIKTDTAKKLEGAVKDFGAIDSIPCGINPAKIKCIWNEQFQNTFIATREFEERLKTIHDIGDPSILDLYVNNLGKPLYYIDSLAALRWHMESDNKFEDFAARRDGRVKTGSVQFEMLKKYYENKTKAYTEAVTKLQNEYWNKQAEMDGDAINKRSQHVTDSSKRMQKNYNQELDLNMKEAYRQLGRGVPPTVYSCQVRTTGW
jgi:hypothetical protein